MASYENLYTGGYSSLNSDYGNFIGYRLKAENLGFPGSPQTANQLGETVNAIKQGTKVFELGTIQPEVFEQIPTEHFKEIAALTKLTGVKPSMHAPIVDPAGFGERGWEGDTARRNNEQRMISFMEKAHELDPKGNTPVVFHSTAGIPGSEYIPDENKKPGEKGRYKERVIIAINQETKEMVPLEEERKYRPLRMEGEDWKKGELVTAKKWMESVNASQWDNKIIGLEQYNKQVDEVNDRIMQKMSSSPQLLEFGKIKNLSEDDKKKLNDVMPDIQRSMAFVENNRLVFDGLFHNAYKYGTPDQQEKLKKMAEEWKDERKEKIRAAGDNPFLRNNVEIDLTKKYFNEFKGLTMPTYENPDAAPKIFKPVEEFAMDKAAETFGNVAFESYKKFGSNAPIMAIENMYQGMAFAKPEDFTKLLDKTRKNFVEKAREKKGLSESAAEDIANKIIGATWDVGHLNMMRKHGFKEEDIVEATKKVAKYVKHVHITDNFGYSDSHLAPGMGNVPIKKILEELEKTGRLDKMRKIVEAGGFVQHFKKSPLPYTLGAFGSPIYGGGPYFNQVENIQGAYFGSPLAYLPEKHFSMYGTGFSALPMELGGQIPGTQSRFSGTPNA